MARPTRRAGDTGTSAVFLAGAVALALVAASCSNDTGPSEEAAAADPTTSIEPRTAATTQGDDPLLIQTSLGPVQGAPSAVDDVRSFLDIPFAEPPTGDLAWRPPQPAESWDEPLDATEPGPSCPQGGDGVTSSFLTTPPSDPDCLHLNVWAPDDAEGLPVMVWIHGGSLTGGSASQPYYNGDDLAAEGVVVVGMNYRLGPQGFLATVELAAESDDGAVANFGLLDQRAALDWVQDNAPAFGGDPDNVTLFGESAGGFSVCGHLAAPGSAGLFDKAVVQSGGGCDDLQPLDDAERAGRRFMEAVGCADTACLRSKADDDLLAVDFDPSLVSDGVTLTDTANDLAEHGALDDVPVLIGANADEATLFTLRTPEPSDAGLVELARRFTDDPAALLALYPAADHTTNLDRLRAMSTDATMVCPALEFAAVAPDAFAYHFTYVSDQFLTGLGATHGFELAPLFAHPEGIAVAEPGGDADDLALSDDLQQAWAAFAATGDPGDAFEPYADNGLITILDVPVTQAEEIRGGRCPQVTALTAD